MSTVHNLAFFYSSHSTEEKHCGGSEGYWIYVVCVCVCFYNDGHCVVRQVRKQRLNVKPPAVLLRRR